MVLELSAQALAAKLNKSLGSACDKASKEYTKHNYVAFVRASGNQSTEAVLLQTRQAPGKIEGKPRSYQTNLKCVPVTIFTMTSRGIT
ncbi:hypothetical protein T265_08077 [Opisthorchis viverrini]|uniref:Uncharacterized protein n=1 Tax=Opisthorchis viverrini TaxID=6198 RepID=A0A075A9P1_OPIVI|nr:hypothetical protein T265_08077 [Opisthorchis viverrini]KER24234.1 hypothetical protein T265_08077 [Opisthorchis viverrini]